jgi:hypothetical protein
MIFSKCDAMQPCTLKITFSPYSDKYLLQSSILFSKIYVSFFQSTDRFLKLALFITISVKTYVRISHIYPSVALQKYSTL